MLEIEGVVDITRATELHGQLCQEVSDAAADVVVGFARAERIDTAIAQLLVATDRALRAKGFHVWLTGCNEQIGTLLTHCGLAAQLQPKEHA